MSKNVITCLLVTSIDGDLYDERYVQILSNMVKRNTTMDYEFVCYSDRSIPGIDVLPISDPFELDPYWYKLRLLDHPDIRQYTTKIFFDIDVVIHGNIDRLFYSPEKLNVIQSRWKPEWEINSHLNTGCCSDIMVWNNCAHITERFEANATELMSKYKGIDRFLWHEMKNDFEYVDPSIVYSYSYGSSLRDTEPYKMRPDRSVCIYNQFPKPHEHIQYEPAKSHWQ
jgi:hypothetical protein